MREKSYNKQSSKPRSFGQFAWMSLLALSFLGSDCQPTGPEAAGAVMIASPFAFLGGLVALRFLHWIWKPMIDARPFFRKSFGTTFAVLVVLALLGNFAVEGAADWATIALWVFCTSYLSVLLVVWRIWLFKKSKTAFSLAPIATMVGLLVPAAILLFVPLSREPKDAIIAIAWVWPGLLGYVTFPLFMMAVSEAVARRIFPKNAPENDSNKSKELHP